MLLEHLLDPWLWLEGSYELGFVHPSFHTRSVLRIGSLVFSETQHGFRGPCGVVPHRAGFVKENVSFPKWGK